MKTNSTNQLLLCIIFNLCFLIHSFSIAASPRFIFIQICETIGGGNIGAPADYEHMYRFAEGAANQANMEFVSYRFEKHQLSDQLLSQFLNQLDVESEDTVFFYYSGVSFNTPGSDFPAFRIENTIYTMDWVERKLRNTRPRLQIIMYEGSTYQHDAFFPIRTTCCPFRFKYRKLFAKAKGSLKFASNSPENQQYSFGNTDSRSAFTNAFINAVDKVVREAMTIDEATWKKIISETKKLTEQFATELYQEQTPIADNNITEEGSLWPHFPQDGPGPFEQLKSLKNPDRK